jgi:hypothetical protein
MSLHGRKNLPVGSSISSSAGAPVIHGDAADKAVRLLRARRERPRRRAAERPCACVERMVPHGEDDYLGDTDRAKRRSARRGRRASQPGRLVGRPMVFAGGVDSMLGLPESGSAIYDVLNFTQLLDERAPVLGCLSGKAYLVQKPPF